MAVREIHWKQGKKWTLY